MTHKSGKVAALVAGLEGRGFDARYLGYFECFNRGLFYEAHDVLEDLWLLDRRGRDGDFHKGLIQLAGAFVLLGKHRPRGACALFDLAEANLRPRAPSHLGADVAAMLELLETWRERARSGDGELRPDRMPRLAPPGSGR